MRNFKRKPVTSERYLKKLIHYIHYNPVEAGLTTEPNSWRYSSYQAILSKRKTLVNRQLVIDLFENKENFIYCHREPPDITGIE